MGNLPYARNQSYAPSTPVASVDLNDVQDGVVRAHEQVSGRHVVIADEFEKNALDGRWSSSGTVVMCDDANNVDAWGVARLDPGAGTTSKIVTARTIPLGSRAWRCSLLAKLQQRSASALSSVHFGVGIDGEAGNTDQAQVQADNSQANWQWKLTAGGVTTSGDTGVAITPTAYQLLELRSDGLTIEFLINGTVVATGNLPQAVAVGSGFTPQAKAIRDAGDATSLQLMMDAFKLWVAR